MKKWYRGLAVILVICCFGSNFSNVQGCFAFSRTEHVKYTSSAAKAMEAPEQTVAPEPTVTLEPTVTPEQTVTPEPTVMPSNTPSLPPATEPGKKPQKLLVKINQKKRRITLRWNALQEASSYVIYRKEAGGRYRKITVKNKKSYSFTVDYGKTYFVKMAAKNKKKIFSKTKSYKIYIPLRVGSVCTVSGGKQSVRLAWEAVRRADGYYIYRRSANQKKYTLLAKRKKCVYLDEELHYNKDYYYKIVAITKRDGQEYKGPGRMRFFSNKKVVNTTRQKYRYTDMEKDIKELKKKYYGLIDMRVIGKSEDGRKIYDVIIGNPNASKKMLVIAALHGREYMTSLLCMNQIEHYLQNYYEKIGDVKVENVLKQITLHFVPMANPDGVTISQDGIAGIKSLKLRAKLSKMSDAKNALWKANARGVNLNQNFPYQFKKLGKKPGSEAYSGKKAASESETRAIISLLNTLKKQNLVSAINYHATGSIVFGDCEKKGKLKENTQKMYALAKQMTGYADSAGYEKEHKGGRGSLREYILYKKKIPSITLEIAWNPCPVPISEFASVWKKNANLVLREAMLF